MTDQLSLYNNALMLLGERKLASLSENREPRRVLDDVWNAGAVTFCLEQGLWGFSLRTVQKDYDNTYTPTFGYAYRFAKPDDYVRTAGVASDEYFNNPWTQYTDEAGYWYANITPLFIRYVSSDASYGGDMSLWSATFTRFVETYLAKQAAPRITQNRSKEADVAAAFKDMLRDARSYDAMNQPALFPPRGSWSASRFGRSRCY